MGVVDRMAEHGHEQVVFCYDRTTGIQVALGHVTGTPELDGRRVDGQGLGGVGAHLAQLLVRGGAVVVGADADPARAKEIAGELGITVEDPERLFDVECDVFSPNAVGGVLNEHTIPRLHCRIVAGGANNQLATAQDGRRLFERGILYAPDYVINSAAPYAVIGAGELGFSPERLAASVHGVAEALEVIFRRAQAESRPSAEIADRIAEERIAAAAASSAAAAAVSGAAGRGRWRRRRARPLAAPPGEPWNTLTWFPFEEASGWMTRRS